MAKRIWTKEEEDLVRKHYTQEGSKRLSEMLCKSQQQIISKASHLGVRCEVLTGWRSPKAKASMGWLFNNYGSPKS